MKVRTITIGIQLEASDFLQVDGVLPISLKLSEARRCLDTIKLSLTEASYEVQTQRVALNSIEEWLICGNDPKEVSHYVDLVQVLVDQLSIYTIEFCSIGSCSDLHAISLIPALLAVSDRLYCSALFKKTTVDDIAPNLSLIRQASQTLLKVSQTSGVIGCFRYCASFNCSAGTPFFPAAFHEEKHVDVSNTNIQQNVNKNGFMVCIGLECADLLFVGFYGAVSPSEGSRNLGEVLKQAILPIQSIVSTACDLLHVSYGGVDASINPGLSLPDSVGAGLENLLFFPEKPTSSIPPLPAQQFGEFGTLAAVSAVTSAVKSLASHGIKLIGYNGLMLPVMEDLILAERASQNPPTFSLRDLLIFSSVCGVGLDTVPVPGDISEEMISSIYMETAALAFRLDKPLSCRLLLMENKKAGDLTEISHPYICNTRVFRV